MSDEPLDAEELEELKRLRVEHAALEKKLEQTQKAIEIMEAAHQKLLRINGDLKREGDTR